MKGIVTESAQICDGTMKYVISDQGFMNRVGARSGSAVRNLSRFGSTILGGLKNLDRHLREIRPGDKVVLEFGGNDCNFDWKAIADNPEGQHEPTVTLARFHELYAEVIEKVRSVGAEPVLLSLPALLPGRFLDFVSRGLDRERILQWLGNDETTISNWHEQYNIEIFKLGAQYGAAVVDISTVFLEQRGLEDYYCIDGMHPNERGHALIAEAVMRSGLVTAA